MPRSPSSIPTSAWHGAPSPAPKNAGVVTFHRIDDEHDAGDASDGRRAGRVRRERGHGARFPGPAGEGRPASDSRSSSRAEAPRPERGAARSRSRRSDDRSGALGRRDDRRDRRPDAGRCPAATSSPGSGARRVTPLTRPRSPARRRHTPTSGTRRQPTPMSPLTDAEDGPAEREPASRRSAATSAPIARSICRRQPTGCLTLAVLVDLDAVALCGAKDLPARLLLGGLALEVGLVEARDRVADVRLVVDRQMLAAVIDRRTRTGPCGACRGPRCRVRTWSFPFVSVFDRWSRMPRAGSAAILRHAACVGAPA